MSTLKRVRELRNLADTEVAEHSGISLNRLRDFESDKRSPSALQLEKLASIYNISPFALLSNQIPNLNIIPTDYRKSQPVPAALSPRALQTIWRIEGVGSFTKTLADELKFSPLSLPDNLASNARPEVKAQVLRSAFRRWLHGKEHRLGFVGSPEAQFFGALRVYVEARGLMTSVNDAPPKDYLGFYIHSFSSLPSIFVNRKISSKKAQLFTFAHEIYHSLEDRVGISNPFRPRNDVERACNRFAAEFLAPADDFAKVAHLASKEVRSTAELIRYMSKRTLLSNHAAAIRLVETGYLSQELLATWLKGWSRLLSEEKEEERGDEPSFGVVHAKRLGEIGYLPVALAAQAIEKKICDQLDVVKGIGLAESIQSQAFELATRRLREASIE